MAVRSSPSASADDVDEALAILDDALGPSKYRHALRLSGRQRIVVGRWRHDGASVSLGGVAPTRLIFSLTGGQRLHWHHGGRSVAATARCGTLAVVRHDPAASIDVVGRGDTLQILIPPNQISQAPPPGMASLSIGTVSARLRWLAAQAVVALRREDGGRLDAILLSAVPLIGLVARRPEGPVRGGLPPAAADRIKAEVSARLRADPERLPSVRDLAERAGLSVYHFIRAFHASEGTTPHAWMADQRREMALAHLLDDGAAVIDAATGAGYSSASHFIATFRRAYGVTPGRLQDAVLGA